VTSTLGRCQPRPVDLLSPTLQTNPEAIDKNIAIARARTRSRILAVVKADGYGHGAITAGAEWLGTTNEVCPVHAWDTLIGRAWQGQRRGRSVLRVEWKGALPWR
jgi:hypothetical protein